MKKSTLATAGGSYYNYFRDYDPSIGRYTTSDPIGLSGGLNTYAYANLNPNMYVDPNGQSALHALRGAGTLAYQGATRVGAGRLGAWAGSRLAQLVHGSPLIAPSVTIGPWDGAGGLVDPDVAGDEAADEVVIADADVCPGDGGGNDCSEIRRKCMQKCIDKRNDLDVGGVSIGIESSDWMTRCRNRCASKLGC